MIKKETRLSQITSGVMWMVGGIILILADTSFDLALFHFIRIPFGNTILGLCIIIYGGTKIFPRKERPPKQNI
jgi:hypothetical protein